MSSHRQTQVRHDAIEKLAEHGIWLARASTLAQIAAQIEKLTGKKRINSVLASDYVGAWVDVRQPVNPPYRPPFRPMRPNRHPRADDIERSQPRLWTPSGTGNWNQYTQYMMDNGRAR